MMLEVRRPAGVSCLEFKITDYVSIGVQRFEDAGKERHSMSMSTRGNTLIGNPLYGSGHSKIRKEIMLSCCTLQATRRRHSH